MTRVHDTLLATNMRAAGGKSIRTFMFKHNIPFLETHRQLTPLDLIPLAASHKVVVALRDPVDRAVSAFYYSWHKCTPEWQRCFPDVNRLAAALVDPASGASTACVELARRPFESSDPNELAGHLGKGFSLYFNNAVLRSLERSADVYVVRVTRMLEDFTGMPAWLKGSKPGMNMRRVADKESISAIHEHNNSAAHAAGDISERLALPLAVHLAPQYHIVARLLCMSANAGPTPQLYGRMQLIECSSEMGAPLARFVPCNLSAACHKTVSADVRVVEPGCVVHDAPRAAWLSCPPAEL